MATAKHTELLYCRKLRRPLTFSAGNLANDFSLHLGGNPHLTATSIRLLCVAADWN